MDDMAEGRMSEKPLSIQVAEALGWTQMEPEGQPQDWFGKPPDWDKSRLPGFRHHVPDYTTNWHETGPLIAKNGIKLYVSRYLGPDPIEWGALHPGDRYRVAENTTLKGIGSTPLIAVCHLILAMKEAGKFKWLST